MKKCSTLSVIILCLYLTTLTGCNTLQDTQFSPIDARLEPIQAGGAQHFVLVNSSSQELHHYHFRVCLWGKSTLEYVGNSTTSLPARVPERTYTCDGYGDKWQPGQVLHFRDRDLGSEGRVLRPVSRVQIVGSCDEGVFREDWQINSFGQLQQVGRTQ